jgi:lysophospholipase L1-like esterase
MRRHLAHLALMAGAVGAGLVGAEVALRVSGYAYSPLHIEPGQSNDWREAHAFRDRHFAFDPELIWRPRPGLFSAFNVQGVRGAPLARDKDAASLRLIALGDSNTFGWVEDDEANWPAQLERALRPACARCEVANAGVWGYTSFQGLLWFRETLALAPDIVLVSFGANDAHPVAVPDADYVRARERARLLERAAKRSSVAQLAIAAWDRATVLRRRGSALAPRVPLDAYDQYLRAIVREARVLGIDTVLLTRPFSGSSDDPALWKTYAPDYNAATRRVAAEEGVLLVDLYEAFAGHADAFADESHFNEEGHRRAGALVARAVAPLVAARLAGR